MVRQGKSTDTIVTKCAVSRAMVSKVRKALEKEDAWKSPKKGELTPSKVKKGASTISPVTDSVSKAAFVEFTPKVMKLAMTPDIFMSYMCALKTGYEGDLGQWVSLVSRDFWLGRGRNFYAEVAGVGSDGNSEGE